MKKLLGFGVVALALAGCGGNKVSVSGRIGTKTPMALTAASGTNQLVVGNVTIDGVKIVVRRIRLEPTVAPPGQSSSGEDELGIGPYLLDFGATYFDKGFGTLQQAFTAPDVPSGIYKQIKFEIHKIEPADPQFGDMSGLSVRITGNCPSCKACTAGAVKFESALDEEQEREGTFDTSKGGNIDINIDPTNWFADPTNTLVPLDPCDSANKSKIESNIKASIDAYEDDNHDGLPDTK